VKTIISLCLIDLMVSILGGGCLFENCIGAKCEGGGCDFSNPAEILKSGYCGGDGCTLNGHAHPHMHDHLSL
jgi:hypothetical protein